MKNIDFDDKSLNRRDFINRLIQFGKIGILGAAGFSFLSKCTGAPPGIGDLDPPFICISPCSSGSYGSTTGTNPVTLIFSGFNPEAGFMGYNVWYGNNLSLIQNDHASGIRSNYVISPSGNNILNAASLGGTSFPSYATGVTVSYTSFLSLTISNTTSGFFILLSAFSLVDNLDSILSNYYLIP
ncbi:MAG: hypothetical protein OEV44_08525 [Spirochaetota bacterium]|nr:hypothetical protein [Spirochaetota bacterium]